jgi:hypothetical protein
MDVQAGHIYPVFDVSRHSGHAGAFTYPDMAPGAYRGGPPLNEFTVDHAGTLVSTAGHVHPGGLRTELDVVRAGAAVSGGAIPGSVTHSARVFRSVAHYFDKRGPISWDMAMTATPGSWRVRVSPGDVLRVSATYETRRASWYESMGIMVVFMAWGDGSGVDPFAAAPDQAGAVTHGHLRENDNHGGSRTLGANPRRFRSCSTRTVIIGAFHFSPGDFQSSGPEKCAPTVAVGQSLSFRNNDASALGSGNPFSPNPAYLSSIFHSVTACQNPCGLDTGISYPLANGPGGYDSGQLGIGQPAVGRLTWSTPRNLAPGTYTYFCRIHPFMRGVFRVIVAGSRPR